MCYYAKLKSDQLKLEKRFGAKFEFPDLEFAKGDINGFSHPNLPIITDKQPNIIKVMEWGLMPHWAKDKTFQKNTLNCMIETAGEKPSFKGCVGNRCLLLVDGFYEWKHDATSGKLVKHKYLITVPDGSPFAIAGIYSNWHGTDTFTILTTEANELMAEIHNSKKECQLSYVPMRKSFGSIMNRLKMYRRGKK